MLLQIDGSPLDWLEGRGPYFSLGAAIDNATGLVPGLVLRSRHTAPGHPRDGWLALDFRLDEAGVRQDNGLITACFCQSVTALLLLLFTLSPTEPQQNETCRLPKACNK